MPLLPPSPLTHMLLLMLLLMRLLMLQVSLTSSVDRECGAALYLVLFAVLLDMREQHAQQLHNIIISSSSMGGLTRQQLRICWSSAVLTSCTAESLAAAT